LHNAITVHDLKLLKVVLVEKFEPTILERPNTISDIKGNFKQGIVKCLLMRNH